MNGCGVAKYECGVAKKECGVAKYKYSAAMYVVRAAGYCTVQSEVRISTRQTGGTIR
jgi:hypothetical protein